jgi:hypothetical protein
MLVLLRVSRTEVLEAALAGEIRHFDVYLPFWQRTVPITPGMGLTYL